MKRISLIWAVVVASLWLLAERTKDPDTRTHVTWKPPFLRIEETEDANKKKLYWSTDPNPARKEQLAPFHEMYPDLKVVVEPNTFDRTIVQCSTGVGPDLIEIYNTADMVAYIEAGILLDLTPYAEAMGFGPNSTYPRLVGNLMYEGRQYRYPANAASQVLIYNKKKFREAGLPYPESGMLWDDFLELMKPLTLKRESGRGYRQFALVLGEGYITDLLLQHGASMYKENGTRSALDSPEAIAAMQFYYDLMRKHEIIPTPSAAESLSAAGGWGFGEIRWFAAGHAAAIWGSRWMLVIFRQYPELHEELGVALLPRLTDGEPTSMSGTRGPGINVNCENVEEALLFMQYLASEDYAQVIAMSGDALPPLADYGEDAGRLLNPRFPQEDYQQVFIDSMKYALPMEVSPFISPIVANRIWTETFENVQNDLKSPEQAMRDAARQINTRIEQNVRERPDLQEKYLEARRPFDSILH